MILKSYEVKNNKLTFLTNNLYLLYGENFGLKKDIKKFILEKIKEKDESVETLSIYESEILANDENFYNSVYSGSLFGDKKIITIYEATDKSMSKISDIFEKYPDNVTLIIFSIQDRYLVAKK